MRVYNFPRFQSYGPLSSLLKPILRPPTEISENKRKQGRWLFLFGQSRHTSRSHLPTHPSWRQFSFVPAAWLPVNVPGTIITSVTPSRLSKGKITQNTLYHNYIPVVYTLSVIGKPLLGQSVSQSVSQSLSQWGDKKFIIQTTLL